MDVRIETINGTTYLTTPYNPEMPRQAKALGGRWDGARKAWTFDARSEALVKDLARSVYGTDGSAEEAADLVTVRVRLADHVCGDYAEFAGRRIAERPERDAELRYGRGVVKIAGTPHWKGGSVRNPRLEPGDVVVEIRDLPRAALAVADADSYEIVEAAGPDTDALLAERDRLLARLAEIDALLPEPEGVTATTREAAEALGVSVRTVQRWAKTGKITAAKDHAGRWTVTITIGA